MGLGNIIGRRGGEAVELSSGIIVASTSGLREGVVGIIDALKFAGPDRPFGGVGRDAVGVTLQSGSLRKVRNVRDNH